MTAEQYPIVHEHLFAAIVAVLGADTVTAEVAEAWDRVYWIMADTLIELERGLYRAAGVDDGDVYRRARVVSRIDDPSGTVVVTVRTDGPISGFAPGQYVSVGVTMPDGARQLRQYSLVSAAGGDEITAAGGDEIAAAGGELTFAVKPVAAVSGQPAGEVSNWIAANLRVGDILDVTVPFGDLPVPTGREPLVLISAGIGATPMIGLLEHLVVEAPDLGVQVLHADRDAQSHPLRARQRHLTDQLPNASLEVWYEDGVGADTPGVHAGLLRLDAVPLADDAQIYLCGNNGFVQAVRAQLVDRGVPASRVHCELFSPNDWLLG